jgi:membrane-associated phospholipid phosphatase
MDQSLGRWVYTQASANSYVKTVATVVGISADEAVWFPLPFLVAALAWPFGALTRGNVSALCDVFGDVAMVCVVETVCKAVVRRARPTYAPQGHFYCLPGEWWSFPSGHTLRASYTVGRVLGDGWRFPALVGVSQSLPGLALWPALVAAARVARGKHYPLDVLVGYCVGVAMASLAMGMGRDSWALTKYGAGSLLTVEALALLAVPKWRLPGRANDNMTLSLTPIQKHMCTYTLYLSPSLSHKSTLSQARSSRISRFCFCGGCPSCLPTALSRMASRSFKPL